AVALGRARAAGAEAHAGQDRLDVDVVDAALEGDVAGREPHVPVAGLGLPARLVPAVGLEQAPAQVVDGGALHVLGEPALRVAGVQAPDGRAVTLHRADAGGGAVKGPR